MTNAYPEKPSLPYEHTSVKMIDVISYIQTSAAPVEVKRCAYGIFRNESANGTRGINNNYGGFQADGAEWPDKFDGAIVGTVTMPENQPGRTRIFCAFASWHASVDLLLDRVEARGLYVGGTTHLITQMAIGSERDLARAYYKEWVTGSADAEPSQAELGSFLSMYGQACALFRDKETV